LAHMRVDMSRICPTYLVLSFFFQAEDGIRDRNVTGVQTCALPISGGPGRVDRRLRADLLLALGGLRHHAHLLLLPEEEDRPHRRSEERRVVKEWRWRWAPEYRKIRKPRS